MKDNILFRPWKELKRLQNRKLHYFINRQLYPFSPYYRRLFDENKIRPDSIRTVADLKRIPFTSKDDFINPPNIIPSERSLDFLLQPDKECMKRYLPKSDLIRLSLTNSLKGGKYLKECL